MDAPFDTLDQLGAARAFYFADPPSGLRAVLVVDDTRLGPAAGGVRTWAYASVDLALRDAATLARSMTVKCALGGLAAGGAKAVVLDHPGLDRPRAFRKLGHFVDELGGLFRTAGDLGTGPADLAAMAETTGYVHAQEGPLAASVARGLLRCLEALAAHRGREVASLRVAVQGAGAIGAAVTATLAEAGAELLIADLDAELAARIAARWGARVCDPRSVLAADVDVLAPCAIGGVLNADTVDGVKAWGVCGAANGVVRDDATAEALRERGVDVVPDVLASAGAVIDGIGESVMGLADRTPLIDALGDTTARVLERAAANGETPASVARALARERLERAASARP